MRNLQTCQATNPHRQTTGHLRLSEAKASYFDDAGDEKYSASARFLDDAGVECSNWTPAKEANSSICGGWPGPEVALWCQA